MEMGGETLIEVSVTVIVTSKNEALNDVRPATDIVIKRRVCTLMWLTYFVWILLERWVLSYHSNAV